MLREMQRMVKDHGKKREFKIKSAILTTEDKRSFSPDTLLDCGCTDSAINRAYAE
jgi:hypothetical protein